MNGQGGLVAVLVSVAAAWLAIALWLSLLAERRIRRANAVMAAARMTAGLLADRPARPMLVGSDDRIEVDAALLRDFGLPREPSRLDDLAAEGTGIDPADLATLRMALGDTRLTAQPIEVQLRGVGSDRNGPGRYLPWLR